MALFGVGFQFGRTAGLFATGRLGLFGGFAVSTAFACFQSTLLGSFIALAGFGLLVVAFRKSNRKRLPAPSSVKAEVKKQVTYADGTPFEESVVPPPPAHEWCIQNPAIRYAVISAGGLLLLIAGVLAVNAVRSQQFFWQHLAIGQARIEQKQDAMDQKIERISDQLLAQMDRKDSEIASLRDQLRAGIYALAKAEQAAGRSVGAMLEELRHGQPQRLLAFLDERIDVEELQLIARHRERAAVSYVLGDHDRAEHSLQFIMAFDPNDVDAINRLGHIYKLRGQTPEAEASYRRILELAGDDEWLQAVAYANLGIIMHVRGDLEGAKSMQLKSLEMHEKLGRFDGMAGNYLNLGIIYRAGNDLRGAEAMHGQALATYEALGDLLGMARACASLGSVMFAQGDLDGAEAMHREALKISEDLGYLQGLAIQYLTSSRTMLRSSFACF